jgi:hypothetical protein
MPQVNYISITAGVDHIFKFKASEVRWQIYAGLT